MALIQCPECGWSVSDRAQSCPKCGCPVNVNGACCPYCGRYNIQYTTQIINEVIGSTRETRKKGAITRAGNSIGRAGMMLATGGLWALTPKRSKYKEIEKVKTRNIQITVGVCQDCGYSWEV